MKKFRIFALILISLALVLACGTGTGGSGANGETPPNGQTPQLPVAVNGVDIDRASPINIPTNSSISITATVRPLDATNKAVSWSIESGANRISFQSPTTTGTTNTIVSGNSTGEATIKVTTADGSFTAERVVRVIPAVPPTSITTEPPAGGLLPLVLGTATGLVRVTGMSPENADSRVRFTSQNENVVTVHEETGVVTAVNLGHTTITVRSFLPASTATSVVNVQVTAPTGGVPPDHLYVWRVDDDGDLVALIDAKTPTAELPWNDPDKDGSYDKPFNVGPIGHGQYIDLVFEASGPSGSNRNLVPHTWSIFGVLENIQPTSVRLRGINNTDDVQKDVMFSISSAVDPNMRVFVKFDVSPASKLADFKVLEAEDDDKHFTHHDRFDKAKQDGTSNTTPYILGRTTSGANANNTIDITVTLEGDGSTVPVNQNIVTWVPIPNRDVISASTTRRTVINETNPELLEVTFTVSSVGAGLAYLDVHPEENEELVQRIWFRVLGQLTTNPTITPATISPADPSGVISIPVGGRNFTLSLGDFLTSDIAKIQWFIPEALRPAYTNYINFTGTGNNEPIIHLGTTTPINAATAMVFGATIHNNADPLTGTTNLLRIEARVWDFYNTAEQLLLETNAVSRAGTTGIISIPVLP